MEIEIESLPKQINKIPTKASNEEGLLEQGAKFVGRLPFRAAETVLGAAGDAAKFAGDVVNFPLKLIGAGVTPQEQQIIRKNQMGLPTSEELKQKTHEALPWTQSEPGSFGEDAERVVELLTSFALPGGISKAAGTFSKGAKAGEIAKAGLSGLASESKKHLGKVFGAETAGWLTKELTGDENKADLVRMGTLVGLQLKGTRDLVRKEASNAYKEASNLAKGAERIHAHGLQNTVHNWLNDLKLGKPTEAKKWAKENFDLLHNKVRKGNFGVNDAVQTVQDIRGELRDGLVPFRAQHYAYDIINELKDSVIKPYEKVNPAFKNTFNAAEQAWSALHKENKFTNFVREKLIDKPWVSKIGAHLFGSALVGAAHKSGLTKAVPYAGAALAGREAYRFIDLLKNSSIARNTFYNLVKQGAAGNVSAASKLASKFDEEAAKYESTHSIPTEETEEIEIESMPT